MKIEEIIVEAQRLPLSERLSLANHLLSEEGAEVTKEMEVAWDNVIRGRIKKYDEGMTSSRSAFDVLNDLDKRLSQ